MRFSQQIAPRTSEVVDTTALEPGPGEVLVRVSACGVCASELRPWTEAPFPLPHRFGHEPVGVVAGVGSDVTTLREGDRVTGLFRGAYADCCLASETELLRVPSGVNDESALGEPMACLVNAQRRTPVDLADSVAVIGLGYMGLGMVQLMKLRGPRRIVGIDVREDARKAARQYGADEVYAPYRPAR